MGNANKRGTHEERKKSALEQQNESAIRLMKTGVAPHYAFILDRSPVGQQVLNQMKNGPDELKARVSSEAVKLWEGMSNFEYVVIWGSWGFSGGLTLPTANLNFLLNEALPAAMTRTNEKGGMCAFIPAVSESVREVVLGKIAELQPVAGQSAH